MNAQIHSKAKKPNTVDFAEMTQNKGAYLIYEHGKPLAHLGRMVSMNGGIIFVQNGHATIPAASHCWNDSRYSFEFTTKDVNLSINENSVS